MCPFLNFSSRCLIFHTISQIAFPSFCSLLKCVCKTCFVAVVGRGEREEKTGEERIEALLTFFSLLKEC